MANGKITYRRSAKRRAAGFPIFLPAIAAILALSVALPGWFLWGMMTEESAGEISRPAQAAGWPEPQGAGRYFIRISRGKFFPAETILVNVSSVPRAMIESNAVVGIKPEGSPEGALLCREYIHKREAVIRLRAPITAGNYEIVGYDNGTVLNDRTEAVKMPFTVENNSGGAFLVSLDKQNYSPSEEILAFVSGVPREMRDDNAMIGIYRSGAPHGKYSEYEYIRRESEKITLSAPNGPGDYEIRAFSNGSILSGATMTARIPFTVYEYSNR